VEGLRGEVERWRGEAERLRGEVQQLRDAEEALDLELMMDAGGREQE
jgi:hypothetical protein